MIHKHHQKLFGFLLLVSFLLLVYVEGLHHHQDNLSHANCPLCVATQQTAIISGDTSSLLMSHDVQIASCDSVPELISLKDRKTSFVRGPPV